MPSAFVLFVLACTSADSGADSDTDKPGDTGEAALPGVAHTGSVAREAAPSTADVPTLGDQNAELAIDLLRTLTGTENLLTSPWSLQLVVAQAYGGAAGDAKAAIADTFHWSLADDAFHEAFNATSLAIDAHTVEGEFPVTVQSTNQVFVTTGYPLESTWLDLLSENYGTGVQEMDFASDPAGVAADINAWILDRTGGHIDNLITEQMVADSRMLLVNALFFKASWALPFTEVSTVDDDFTLLDGTTTSVPTMHGSMNLRGATGDGYFAVELPYTDQGLAMTLLLPDEGRFAEVAGSLSWAELSATLDSVEPCDECSISLPKFGYRSTPDVRGALEALGFGPAFGGDYSGISPGLTLTDLQQMAFVEVNEKGTEAAAATVGTFSDSASIPPFGPVVVDRPFLYLIRDVETSTVLFAGAVVDPR